MDIIFKYMTDSQPSWFDWLSLAVMIGSIFCAYYFGEKNYKREKEDRKKEETENIKSEKDLFDNNLYMLKMEIEEQIENLKKYVAEKGFRIKVNPKIQIDFLHFVSIKSLYKNNDRDKVNKLLSALYGLSNFYDLLKREVDDCNTYYNKEEKIFQENYRDVFYKQVHMLNNKRAEEFKQENGQIQFKYKDNDDFMNEYMGIANLFEQSTKGVDGKADKIKISDELIKVAHMSHKYIPYDYDAIIINNIANKAHSAYINMENRRNQHFKVIATFIKILKDTNKEIVKYSRK